MSRSRDRHCATDPPGGYRPERDGDHREWLARRTEAERIAADAQRAWEEKARADAEEWAKREAGAGKAEDS